MLADWAKSADGASGAVVTNAATARTPDSKVVLGIISRPKRGFDDCERALAADVVDRPHAEHRVQLLGRHLHRAGRGGASRRRLRECGRARGMERDVAVDLLLDLLHMAVEHGCRPETPQIAETAGSVLAA